MTYFLFLLMNITVVALAYSTYRLGALRQKRRVLSVLRKWLEDANANISRTNSRVEVNVEHLIQELMKI